MSTGIPDSWYDYNWPLADLGSKAPVPSRANYSPKNVAPLIEFFASILSVDKSRLVLKYENNTPQNLNDDISVRHPMDKDYLGPYRNEHKVKSNEQMRYEDAAKKSARLIAFQDNSPAQITYFQTTKPI